jgi:hypothetical protein
METDAILGCIIVAISVIVMIALVFWSRRTINRIARNGGGSVREILRDLRSGR